jgi:hypothetical protein
LEIRDKSPEFRFCLEVALGFRDFSHKGRSGGWTWPTPDMAEPMGIRGSQPMTALRSVTDGERERVRAVATTLLAGLTSRSMGALPGCRLLR